MDLTPEVEKIKRIRAVDEGALAWIQGSGARQQAAIDQALALGATAAQLAPVQAELDATLAVEQIASAIATPGPGA
jgi:hypothetical protein